MVGFESALLMTTSSRPSPSKKWKGDLSQPSEISHVSEIRIAVVVIKHIRIVRKIRNLKTDPPRVIVIADRYSHPCLLAPVFVQRHTRRVTNFLKSTVAF